MYESNNFNLLKLKKEGEVTFLKADVSVADDCRKVISTAIEKYGSWLHRREAAFT